MSKGCALLECESVTRKAVVCSVKSLKEWGKKNAKYLFDQERETRDYGFVIVTSTFRTNRCSLRCWPKADKFSATDGVSLPILTSNNDLGEILAKWGQKGWIKVPDNESSVWKLQMSLTFRTHETLWFS